MKAYKRQWKDPVNGVTAFFTEESFTQVLGSVSLEERLASKLEYETHGSQSTYHPLKPYQVKGKPAESRTEPVSQDEMAVSPAKKSEPAPLPDLKSTGPSAPKQKPMAQRSTLSAREQRRYLELFHKYLMSFRPQQPSPTEIKELTEFESLQMRVSQEQAAFLKYTEQVARCRHLDYNHLLPAARKYINEKLTYEWRRVDHYPRYYVPHTSIPLDMSKDSDYKPLLNHDKLLVELGTFPKVFLPDMTRPPEVPTGYEKINKRFPCNGRKTTNKKAWNHEACSRDGNCEVLALRHGCQVVTCGSALRCLVDNHAPNFHQDWDIPVVIRQAELDCGDISTKQKIVYIDKPFPSKTMTNREKNTVFHKYALKTFITQPVHHRGSRPHPSATAAKDGDTKPTDSTNPFDNDVSMEDLETFDSFDFGKSDKKSKKSFDDDPTQLLASLKAAAQKQKSASKSDSPAGKQTSGEKAETKDGAKDTTECDSMKAKKTDTKNNDEEKKAKVTKVSGKEVKVPLSSSGGDTSQDEALVIDIPDLTTPPGRATRSRAQKDKEVLSPSTEPDLKPPLRRSSSRISKSSTGQKSSVTDTSDDEQGLVIDMGDISSPDNARKTRSQRKKSDEFSVPKRVLRSRKGSEVGMGESETDHSPEPKVKRKTRSRSGSGQRSRTSSESMAVDEENSETRLSEKGNVDSSVKDKDGQGETESGTENMIDSNACALFSPSKVDNIMVKTSNADLTSLPSTTEAVTAPKGRGQKGQVNKTGLSPLDSILQLQEKMLPAGKGKADMSHSSEENLSEFKHPEEHNVAYNLWNFSGLTLLIRSSCHGQLRDLSQKTQPVCIVPKLEYQAKFGVEQVTLSEVARDWITCYVKPHTRLVRGRINGLTSELIKIDELDLNSIVNPSLAFVPCHALASLHNIFLKLTGLPAGNYLLTHQKGDNSCQLLQNTETKRGSHDLKFSYMFGVAPDTHRDVPWIPIDPTVLLPSHRRNGRVPCTFDPSDYVPNMGKNNKQNKKKGQKQKKKPWQKKGNAKKT